MRVIIFFSVLIFFLIPRYIDFPFLLCACKPSCLFGLDGGKSASVGNKN